MILDKKQIYRIYTVLSFLLLIRHSQYYIFANVSTEYGFNQPIWGIALIPITAAFGTSFCIGRRTVLFNNSDYYRLAFVSLLPIVLTILYGFNLGIFLNIPARYCSPTAFFNSPTYCAGCFDL